MLGLLSLAQQAGQAYCYTSNDHEEIEIIFFPDCSDDMDESTISDEAPGTDHSSHYEQTGTNDTILSCEYLDQLALDLCNDITITLNLIEQLNTPADTLIAKNSTPIEASGDNYNSTSGDKILIKKTLTRKRHPTTTTIQRVTIIIVILVIAIGNLHVHQK
jgi:hypothetical protein